VIYINLPGLDVLKDGNADAAEFRIEPIEREDPLETLF
jgi:hypothetical protein